VRVVTGFVLRHQLALVAAACALAAAGFVLQATAARRRERAQDEAMIAAVRADTETRTAGDEAA